MARTIKTIELPSGGRADIISSWTFGEIEQIDRAAAAVTKIRINDDGTKDVTTDGTVATRLTMKLAIKKLTKADGTEVNVTDSEISEMDAADGIALREAINAIGQSEKKA